MHFYNFNIADFNNSTRHLSLPERAIYRDLIDMYYHNEQAIDSSDMNKLARRLLCTTPEYLEMLEYILDEYFVKRGKRHHHHRIDKELKNYKFKNGNADSNGKRNAVTNDVTQGVTPSNDGCNITCNDDDAPMTAAERTRKSRQDKRNMINDLTDIGVSVDKGIGTSALRELHAKHIDAIKQCHASNVANDVTQTVTPSNDDCNAGNAKNAAITSNHEPETNNHKPLEREAHTHAGEAVVDNFNHGSVDNSTDNNQSSAHQPAPVAPAQPTQSTANQQPTKAELIRSQHADSIENWEAPTIDQMRGELFKAGKLIQLTDDQYQFEVSAFKAHYAEQALKGNPLTTESYRKVKLVKWMMREADNQKADQARQEKAKGRFNIDNEDWSNNAGKSSNSHASDLPDVFHPSHSQPVQAKIDPSKCCIFNGLRKEPLPNMDVAATYEHIKQQKLPGESADETYDRVLNQLQEAV
ncbi:YdaU family protein [Psychrobacter sp. CAM01]|uniref:YdaU family protein n=1 Tax=Psychrobacter sp. CAM01 TaxID=3080335 RepID=UPI002936941D|nr:YdaU family protein [Psychrobacter sp. CAM01]MDV2860322.1 YdaU family protein [Psychrobacter sp. CAM01]